MAETVLGIATTLVGGALSVASSAAREEVGLLIGVQHVLRFINDELKMMQAFLEAADGSPENTRVLKAYLEQIHDMAYDIEDYLEEFMIFIKNQSLLQQLFSLGTHHRIASLIRTIKQRVQEVSKRNLRYNLIKLTPSVSDDVVGVTEQTRNSLAPYVEESQLVGLDEPKKKLMEMINKPKGEDIEANKAACPRMISVVGMDGLGKTSLAKKVYESKDGGDPFDTLSQSFDGKELLKEMIKKLFGEHEGIVLKVEHLTTHLQKGLQERRYFIVLDDVWTIEAWDWIRLTFPENIKDGRCVVSPITHLQVKNLEEKDAENLFLRKTNKNLVELEKDNHLKKTVEKILKKCGGLPLAVVTVGGLLTPFLHLSIFPEDFEIKRKHLVNRWIAEGFVITGANRRRTLEEVAGSYFYEHISRSMIQPCQSDIYGNVKTCKLHDIVHDIVVSISSKENHVLLFEEHVNINSATKENIRHLSCSASQKLNSGMDLSRVRSFTLFKEPMDPIASLRSSKFKMLRVLDLSYSEFEARQQDIDGIVLLSHLNHSNIYALPTSIGNLQSLSTLDIRYSSITSLPSEITKLQSLRRLRCSKYPIYRYFGIDGPMECCCEAICLPLVLIRYYSEATTGLHMALSSCWSRSYGVRVPKGLGKLKELQALEEMDIKLTSTKAIKELGELTQLRKLVVTGKGASRKKCKTFCTALDKSKDNSEL
uniref:Rx N-terminal domain-containing protein n=1 Tax=Oryza punctata TaxID=4537 RepID=A0A0E0LAJ9_ORYPU